MSVYVFFFIRLWNPEKTGAKQKFLTYFAVCSNESSSTITLISIDHIDASGVVLARHRCAFVDILKKVIEG
jgi:hypothetical protein